MILSAKQDQIFDACRQQNKHKHLKATGTLVSTCCGSTGWRQPPRASPTHAALTPITYSSPAASPAGHCQDSRLTDPETEEARSLVPQSTAAKAEIQTELSSCAPSGRPLVTCPAKASRAGGIR